MIPVITPVLAGLTGVMAEMAVVAEMEEMVAVMVEAVTL
jgi:hypothetical protein